MEKYEFEKHPDTITPSQQQAAEQFRQQFLDYPPCAYGRFTFRREPPDLDAAVGSVRKVCNRLSGALHKKVWYWVAAERGGVNDRRHCHVFLFGDPKLTLLNYAIVRREWRYGRIIGLSPFVPNDGAEWYMGWKMALGRERALDMSKKLARRIGKLESSADSSDSSTD